MSQSLTDEQIARALKALAEPKRLRIVRLVASNDGECRFNCASLLAELGITQPTLSHHVSELREAGVLVCTPDGRETKLSVNRSTLAALSDFLGKIG